MAFAPNRPRWRTVAASASETFRVLRRPISGTEGALFIATLEEDAPGKATVSEEFEHQSMQVDTAADFLTAKVEDVADLLDEDGGEVPYPESADERRDFWAAIDPQQLFCIALSVAQGGAAAEGKSRPATESPPS